MDGTTRLIEIYMYSVTEIYFAVASYLYGYWLKPFVQKKKSAYSAAFLFWIIDLVGRYIEGWNGFGVFTTVLVIILPIIVSWLLDGRRNMEQKIFLCAVFLLIRWLPFEMFTEIGSYEQDLIKQTELFSQNVTAIYVEMVVWNLIHFGVSLVLLYAAIRVLHKNYKRKDENLTWRELIMLLASAGSLMTVKPIISTYYRLWMECIQNGTKTSLIPGDIFRMIFCVLSYMSILVIIIFYQQIKDKQDEKYAGEALERQVGDMRRHIERIEGIYDDMRAMRHDMGNHMTVIRGLADTGDIAELKEYIEEWKGGFDELQGTVRSGNAVTDIVLSEYAGYCEKEGIPFSCDFHYPEGFEVNAFDISVILNNALQNAFEASAGLPDPGISITSVRRDKVLIINVKNHIQHRVALNEDGLPGSTKEGSGHGYGLKNIRRVAGKYKGDLEIRQEEKDGTLYFVLNVMVVE